MVLERSVKRWELGAFFRDYHRRIPDVESDAPPAEALPGLEGGRYVVERPAPQTTPTGLATWSRSGRSVTLDFVYSTAAAASKTRPRGAELMAETWASIVAEGLPETVRFEMGRLLAGAGEDFASPLAEKLGMEREDDVLMVRSLTTGVPAAPLAKGVRLAGWSDGLLDSAIAVMMAAPDPGRLGGWNEQGCRNAILWAAAGHPPGFGDGRAVTAWMGDKLAGLALAAPEGLVTQVHVRPEYGNRGIATALLADLLERLRRAGCTEASLVAGDTNGEAMRLAERLGFREELRYPTWVWQRVKVNPGDWTMTWNGRMTRDELATMFFRAGSPLAFEPARLAKLFGAGSQRLTVRHLGELLALGRVVGDGDTALLCDLVVDPRVRRQGLGTAMVAEAARRCADARRFMVLPPDFAPEFLEGLSVGIETTVRLRQG